MKLFPGMRALLARLARRARVVILTGRVASEARRIARLPVEVVGLHGREWMSKGGALRRRPVAPAARRALGRLLRIARELASGLPGSRVEDKRPGGVALHTRGATGRAGRAAERAFARAVRAEKRHGIDLLLGKRLTEARAGGVSKGTAAREIAADDPRSIVFFAGDDRTDEDAHRALARRRGAITVKIGAGVTAAKHRVRDIAAFREALASLAWYLRA